MVEGRQDSALVAKAFDDLRAVQATRDDLDCDPLVELPIAALSKVHRAHAATPEFPQDRVSIDVCGPGVDRGGCDRRGVLDGVQKA